MPAVRRPAPIHHRYTLSRLQREWDRLVDDRRLAGRPDEWRLPGVRRGASLADVLHAAGMREPGVDDPAGGVEGERVPGDRVLAALVVAGRDDPLAARLVLQRLLPGLSAVARRRSRCVEDHLRNTDEAVAAAWWVIRTHPVELHPDWVASTLLRAIDHQAFVGTSRRLLVHELVEPSTLDVAVEPGESGELGDDPLSTIVSALRMAGPVNVHPDDTRLIGALLRCDRLDEAARELEVSVRTVRNHRAALIHRLRAAVAA
jgi:hypothetical protein